MGSAVARKRIDGSTALLHGWHGGLDAHRRIDDENEAATALLHVQYGGQGTQRGIDDEDEAATALLHGQHGGQGTHRRIDDEDEAATALLHGQHGGQGTQRRIDDEDGAVPALRHSRPATGDRGARWPVPAREDRRVRQRFQRRRRTACATHRLGCLWGEGDGGDMSMGKEGKSPSVSWREKSEPPPLRNICHNMSLFLLLAPRTRAGPGHLPCTRFSRESRFERRHWEFDE